MRRVAPGASTALAGATGHTRIARAGRHRWTVTGYDAANRRVVSSARSFLAVGRR